MTEKSEDQLVAEGVKYSGMIQQQVDQVLGELEVIHGTVENLNGTDEQILSYLAYTSTVDPLFSNGVYMGDGNGTYLDASWTPDAGYVPSERDWYKEGINHDTMTLGEPYVDADSGEICVSATSKVACRGADNMVMSADIFLSSITDAIAADKVLDSGYTFLVNCSEKGDMILGHPKNENIGQDISTFQPGTVEYAVADLIETADGQNHTISVNGKKEMVVVNKIDNCNWVMISCVDQETVLAAIISLKKVSVIIYIISLLLVALVIDRMVRSTIKPINRLTDNITSITNGDFTVQVESKGNDEVALMSTGLKGFVEQMKTIIMDINQVSNKLDDQAHSSTDVSTTLYSSAESQSDAMKELNDTVEELASSVSEVATNATNLALIVSEAGN